MEAETLQLITSILGDLGFLGFAVYMLIQERNAHERTRETSRGDLEKRHTDHREEVRELRREYETTIQEMHRRRDELTRDLMSRFLPYRNGSTTNSQPRRSAPTRLPEEQIPGVDDTKPYSPLEPTE